MVREHAGDRLRSDLARRLGSSHLQPPRRHAGNLPVELTSFVGRRQGLADIKRALSSARLLTLTGTGGVGKTKLALRAGRESTRQYPDGVWFVELAPIQDPELVPQAVFTALGLQDHASKRAVSTLSDYLADKRPLLILDNCEHVHDGGGRPGRDAAARLSRRPDPRHEPAGARGDRRGRDRRAHPVAARGWRCVAGGAAPVGRGGPVRGASGGRAAGLRRGCRECRRDPERLHAMSTASRSPLELAAVRLQPLGSTAWIVDSRARLGALGTGDRSAVAPRSRRSMARSTGATSS